MPDDVVFSHKKDDWTTPREVFDPLNAEFGFKFDAAASEENALTPRYAAEMATWEVEPGGEPRLIYPAGGLAVPWHKMGGPVWCNPPYSNARGFIEKAAGERVMGAPSVLLLASRTDTIAFHQHIWDRNLHRPYLGIEVRFVKGRIKFGGAKYGAPFPSMVVVFRPDEF